MKQRLGLKKILLHLGLFLITLVGTTFAGAEWMYGKFLLFTGVSFQEFLGGLSFSLPFLGILTVHEFGHYFTAKYYKLKVTLPYYIPMWFFGAGPSIGTMGAFISIKSRIPTRKAFFDVGVSGPLAGFVIAVGVLYYGFTHLPPAEYIFEIHPEYKQWGMDYAKYAYQEEEATIIMGTNLLMEFFKEYVVEDRTLIPNPHEIMHYPFLLAGFLACFFTALNLIPIGQLDGGHVLYGMIGRKWHSRIAPGIFSLFLFFAGLGLFSAKEGYGVYPLYGAPIYIYFLYWVLAKAFRQSMNRIVVAMAIFTAQLVIKTYWPSAQGFEGWLLFAFILGRVLGVHHPPATIEAPIGLRRQLLGWLSWLVFILCFSPMPIEIV
ncbi:site-2 protease family protein [Algivirga pacifica]|uniref:Site-2 protease family protein n=1 Tax=Algivirga pacifica TaxID=1162670 RepID=A0ABP9DP91_9BACT